MRSSASRPNTLLPFLIGVLLAAFFVRTAQLDSGSFWLDEVHSHERASQRSWSAMYDILLQKNHAPLYALLLHYWLALGDTEFVVRFLTTMLGVMSVAATYRLGRELTGEQEAVWGAALLALSPLHIYYSQEARMYVLAALLVTLSLHCLQRAVHSGTRLCWAGYAVFSALSLYTHYYSAFTFLSAGAFLVATATIKEEWNSLLVLAAVHLCVALLFIPWLPTFLAQIRSNPLPWLSRPSWDFWHRTTARLFVHDDVLGAAYPAFAGALAAVVSLQIGVLARKRESARDADTTDRMFVACCTLGPVALATGISLFIKPIVFDRYFVLTAPIASIFLAQSLVQATRTRWLCPLVCFLLVGILVSAYGVATTEWKENWEAAAKYVKQHAHPGDWVIFGTAMHMPPFNHYYRDRDNLPQYALPTDWTSISHAEETLDGSDFVRFWIIRTERFNGSERVVNHVVGRYADRLISCLSFGGRYYADACLYSRD